MVKVLSLKTNALKCQLIVFGIDGVVKQVKHETFSYSSTPSAHSCPLQLIVVFIGAAMPAGQRDVGPGGRYCLAQEFRGGRLQVEVHDTLPDPDSSMDSLEA